MVDTDGCIVDYNKKFIELMGISKHVLEKGGEPADLKNMLSKLENPQDAVGPVDDLISNPDACGDMGETKLADGRVLEKYSQPYHVGNEVVGRVWSIRDVTERRMAEDDLRLCERAITSSSQGMVIFENDEHNKIIYVNSAVKNITGFSEQEVKGQTIHLFKYNEDNASEWLGLMHAVKELREGQAVLHGKRKNGDSYWNKFSLSPISDANKDIRHFVMMIDDITEQKSLEQQLMHQATHDKLTDFPNRLLLEDRIRQSIYFSERRGSGMSAVVILDLDRFKIINDSLSHKIGDDLIKLVANRIRKRLRKTDTVARVGGDEFVLMLSQISCVENISEVIEKLFEIIRKPIYLAGQVLNITASVGISVYPQDGNDPAALIRHADTAMYHAKDAGRDQWQFFEPTMNQRVSKLLRLENDLHKAIENNELLLNYQPVINLAKSKIVGVEALVRWDHPKLGMMSPTEFIYIAEETGLIIPIGDWVLQTACDTAMKWKNSGITGVKMAVNVSARQLQQGKIIKSVKMALEKSGLPAELLVLELTESVLMERAEETVQLLDELKHLGVSLAIDDFGTGYSSLAYLKRFPIDKIKIDRAFVRDIVEDTDNQAIVTAIIAMAKSLNIRVVAEGAETREEMDFLQQHACDELQGYYFSKPLIVDDCRKLIQENLGCAS